MSKEKQETKEPTHYPYNLISIVPEILWNDPNFKGKAEVLLLSYRLKMTDYWNYNDETVAKIFGVSVKYIRKTYAKMIKLGIINENLQLIVDESKKNVIYIKNKTDAAIEQSKKEYAEKKELEDELKSGTVVSNNGTPVPKMESVDSKMESVDSKMESVDSKMESVDSKMEAVSPMKTVSPKESSKESVKESSNEFIKESINESVNESIKKGTGMDDLLESMKDNNIDYKKEVNKEINPKTIIDKALYDNPKLVHQTYSKNNYKTGHIYYKNISNFHFGLSESDYEIYKNKLQETKKL